MLRACRRAGGGMGVRYPGGRLGGLAASCVGAFGVYVGFRRAGLQVLADTFLTASAAFGTHFAFTARALLDDNRRERERQVRADDDARIVATARASQLDTFYETVEAAASDCLRDINRANRRIILCTTSGRSDVRFLELIDVLAEKRLKGLEIRILLLDPLSGAGLFRAIVEGSEEQVRSILESSTPPSPKALFFEQDIYTSSHLTCLTLQNVPALGNCVRFYDQLPPCWLLIADENVYAAPYVFTPKAASPGRAAFSMPVQRFGLESGPGREFDDHLRRLWLMSDIDLDQMLARLADRDRILRKLLRSREQWAPHCKARLCASADYDRRRAPRRAEFNSTIDWIESTTAVRGCGDVLDTSKYGFAAKAAADSLPSSGASLIVTSIHSHSLQSKLGLQRFTKPKVSTVKVIWVDKRSCRFAAACG
jgi:hypothetical protein